MPRLLVYLSRQDTSATKATGPQPHSKATDPSEKFRKGESGVCRCRPRRLPPIGQALRIITAQVCQRVRAGATEWLQTNRPKISKCGGSSVAKRLQGVRMALVHDGAIGKTTYW